jgi:hypothetical protein
MKIHFVSHCACGGKKTEGAFEDYEAKAVTLFPHFESVVKIFSLLDPKQVVIHHKDGSTTTYTKELS